ncbi:MAG: hypothetical protein KAW02_06915 [candidate division Zixibacteria bacterium]|nr:hypothetical protein [candidate division Zixibacteria bacterium]
MGYYSQIYEWDVDLILTSIDLLAKEVDKLEHSTISNIAIIRDGEIKEWLSSHGETPVYSLAQRIDKDTIRIIEIAQEYDKFYDLEQEIKLLARYSVGGRLFVHLQGEDDAHWAYIIEDRKASEIIYELMEKCRNPLSL